jgi:coproporphyrinogen III oxidase-like Fe-S oxidoreductase
MGLSGSLRCAVLLAYLSMTASFAPQVPPATPSVPSRCRPAPRAAVLGERSPRRGPRAPQGEAPQKAASAYVHIPFCKQRCYYCDFPISVVGADTHRPGARSTIDSYLGALEVELERGGGGALSPARPSPDIGAALETIYLGGGTPSLLEPREVDKILRALDRRFGIASGAEISMEMDPGTFDLDKVPCTSLSCSALRASYPLPEPEALNPKLL